MSTPSSLLDMQESFDLESNLDDVPDLPEFVNRFVGRAIFNIITAKKESYTKESVVKERIRIVYKLVQIIEAGEDPMPSIGSMFSETFSPTGQGREFLKQRLGQLIPDITGAPLGLMLEHIVNTYSENAALDMVCTTSKKDGYENIRIVKIAPVEMPAISASA